MDSRPWLVEARWEARGFKAMGFQVVEAEVYKDQEKWTAEMDSRPARGGFLLKTSTRPPLPTKG